MFCTSCGANVPNDSLFCTKCGAKLTPTSATAPFPTAGAASAQAATPTQASSTAPAQNPQQNAPRYTTSKRSRNISLIIIAAVVVVAIAMIAFFMWRAGESGSSSDSSSTQTSTSQGSSSDSDTGGTGNTDDDSDSDDSGYIIADSGSRYLTESELSSYTDWELYIARNEIYARHGRGFKNEDLAEYFAGQSWYTQLYTPEEFDAKEGILNDYERKNAELILSVEKSRNSPYLS